MKIRLFFLIASASLAMAQEQAAMVSVVAIGSTPKSVVKWDADGQNEYVLAEPKALPPSNLHVKVAKDEASKFQPFTLALNIPTPPVLAAAAGLPLYQGAANGQPAADAAPLLVVPVAAGVSRQVVMMYRKDPAADWDKPEYFPVNLEDPRFPAASIGFVNLSGGPVRIELPPAKGAMSLGHRQLVSAKAPAGAATLNYKITAPAAGNKLEPVAFTGLRASSSRQVVVIYKSNERKTVCSSFVLAGD